MAEIKGGQQLENVLENLSKQLGQSGQVRVGFLENSSYPDGTPTATIAAIMEYGAPSRGIPPRPFFRNMIARSAADWPRLLKAALAGGANLETTLGRVGDRIAGQLRESIVDTNDPPLAPSTVKAKGFAKPLVDTGHMLASVDYEVSVGGETTSGSDNPGMSEEDFTANQAARQGGLRAAAILRGSK